MITFLFILLRHGEIFEFLSLGHIKINNALNTMDCLDS